MALSAPLPPIQIQDHTIFFTRGLWRPLVRKRRMAKDNGRRRRGRGAGGGLSEPWWVKEGPPPHICHKICINFLLPLLSFSLSLFNFSLKHFCQDGTWTTSRSRRFLALLLKKMWGKKKQRNKSFHPQLWVQPWWVGCRKQHQTATSCLFWILPPHLVYIIILLFL